MLHIACLLFEFSDISPLLLDYLFSVEHILWLEVYCPQGNPLVDGVVTVVPDGLYSGYVCLLSAV